MLLSAACAALPSKKPTLLIYGDSLTVLSEAQTRLLYSTSYNVVFRAQGGTSMCDWTGHAAADRAIYQPARVVIAFTGNSATCSLHSLIRGGEQGWLANYQHALLTMRHTFDGVPMSVVASPAMLTPQPLGTWFPENGSAALNSMYQEMCAKYGMYFNTAADDTLTPKHTFHWMRPAFPGSGKPVLVRAPDGVHLMPAGALYYGAALGKWGPVAKPAPKPTPTPTPKSSPTPTPTPTPTAIPTPTASPTG